MLMKSTCKRSIGAVATIGCRGTLDKLPSCCKHHMQDLIHCHIWVVIPGHQKCSHNRVGVWSCPWLPTSPWHPFKMVTWWALGTMKSRRSSVSPLGIEGRCKAPWWIIKFCQFHQISLPSSLEACSARNTFKSAFFFAFSQSNTVLNIRSSFWASAQSVTCICTSTWPAATHISCSKWWSPSTMQGHELWPSALFPMWHCWGVIPLCLGQLSSNSAKCLPLLSHPFWYSNSKFNCTRTLTLDDP